MNKDCYWNLFIKTGNIEDYLNYACTSEMSLNENRISKFTKGKPYHLDDLDEFDVDFSEEGGLIDKPGNLDGDGPVGYADW